jgi:hypothetical protein
MMYVTMDNNMTLNNLIDILEKMVPDRIPREKLEDFDLGKLVGNIEIIDYIKSLTNNKEGK